MNKVKFSFSMTASEFVCQYSKKSGISEREFYHHFIPMPDRASPNGWSAVSNSPISVKSHVDLYM